MKCERLSLPSKNEFSVVKPIRTGTNLNAFSHVHRHGSVPFLQKNAGNQAVIRLASKGRIQHKGGSGSSMIVQREETPQAQPLFTQVSPFMASAVGSETIDGFVTGKSDISPQNEEKLKFRARMILGLLLQYPGSSISVTGHTDAVGTDERNTVLGMARADSTAAVLVKYGVPVGIIAKESKGESELLIKTQNAEPRNRRAEIRFTPLIPMYHTAIPKLGTGPDNTNPPSYDKPEKPLILFPRDLPNMGTDLTKPVPDNKPRIRNWLEEGLKKDPLIKSLPPFIKDKVVDALKDGDEKIAEKTIDSLPLGDKEKAALKAVVLSILQMMKGKVYEPPPDPSWRQVPPDFGNDHSSNYKAPGEVIIPSPVLRW